MSEEEWLACYDPQVMFWHLEKKASDRKLRLVYYFAGPDRAAMGGGR